MLLCGSTGPASTKHCCAMENYRKHFPTDMNKCNCFGFGFVVNNCVVTPAHQVPHLAMGGYEYSRQRRTPAKNKTLETTSERVYTRPREGGSHIKNYITHLVLVCFSFRMFSGCSIVSSVCFGRPATEWGANGGGRHVYVE